MSVAELERVWRRLAPLAVDNKSLFDPAARRIDGLRDLLLPGTPEGKNLVSQRPGIGRMSV